MAIEFTIPQIIEFAKQSQVNSQLKISQDLAFKGDSLNPYYSRLLYIIRKSVEYQYVANPNFPTLRQVAEYLYALSRPFIINTATISITSPANATVNVGGTANFVVSVFVSNSSPYTIQWYRNNVAIPGATGLTYSLTNAQLSDSGATFYATAISPGVGTVSSTTAVLVVNAVIVGYYYYGDVDYSALLEAGTDTVPYVGTFPINNGQPLSIPLPPAAANTFMVFKYPISQSVKTNYTNLPINVGVIPSIAWNGVVTFGGWRYIFTRTGHTFGLNSVNPLIFS